MRLQLFFPGKNSQDIDTGQKCVLEAFNIFFVGLTFEMGLKKFDNRFEIWYLILGIIN